MQDVDAIPLLWSRASAPRTNKRQDHFHRSFIRVPRFKEGTSCSRRQGTTLGLQVTEGRRANQPSRNLRCAGLSHGQHAAALGSRFGGHGAAEIGFVFLLSSGSAGCARQGGSVLAQGSQLGANCGSLGKCKERHFAQRCPPGGEALTVMGGCAELEHGLPSAQAYV